MRRTETSSRSRPLVVGQLTEAGSQDVASVFAGRIAELSAARQRPCIRDFTPSSS